MVKRHTKWIRGNLSLYAFNIIGWPNNNRLRHCQSSNRQNTQLFSLHKHHKVLYSTNSMVVTLLRLHYHPRALCLHCLGIYLCHIIVMFSRKVMDIYNAYVIDSVCILPALGYTLLVMGISFVIVIILKKIPFIKLLL